MMLKRLFALIALLTVLFSSLGFAAPAMAQSDNSDAGVVAICREADEEGFLDDSGLTFGECVAAIGGQTDGNLSRFVAGLCGADFAQEQFGSKGQCVSTLQEFIRENRANQP